VAIEDTADAVAVRDLDKAIVAPFVFTFRKGMD
jgi:hypothetical protein